MRRRRGCHPTPVPFRDLTGGAAESARVNVGLGKALAATRLADGQGSPRFSMMASSVSPGLAPPVPRGPGAICVRCRALGPPRSPGLRGVTGRTVTETGRPPWWLVALACRLEPPCPTSIDATDRPRASSVALPDESPRTTQRFCTRVTQAGVGERIRISVAAPPGEPFGALPVSKSGEWGGSKLAWAGRGCRTLHNLEPEEENLHLTSVTDADQKVIDTFLDASGRAS